MKRFSAQLVYTNTGPPLRRGIITTDDNGNVLGVEDTGGKLSEYRSVEFYNGIIVPGFVNCHCHLELSYLKDLLYPAEGLGEFIMQVRSSRENTPSEDIVSAAAKAADDEMHREGIVLCADICNTSSTFSIKNKSRILYLNLLEVFEIDPGKASKRLAETEKLSEEATAAGFAWSIVPHSVYSVSLPLFRKLKERTSFNEVTTIHFMESEAESLFLSDHSGPLRISYESSGLMPVQLQMPENHKTAVLKEVTPSGNLILVHNTFADREIIRELNARKNLYWCLCPGSNLFIEGRMPPAGLLVSEGCIITTGTDSLASNKKLSILGELKTLQEHFPSITLDELIRWATVNGARALGYDHSFGTIVPGKKPGLVLLENVDLQHLKLNSETVATRLI